MVPSLRSSTLAFAGFLSGLAVLVLADPFPADPAAPLSLPRSTVDWSPLNREPTVVDGVSLPRTTGPKYRGFTEQQASFADVIQGLLGNPLQGMRAKEVSRREAKLRKDRSAPDALAAAIAEVDAYFLAPENRNRILQQYVIHASGCYSERPTGALYFTSYAQTAAIYAQTVLVLRERAPRGVDLNDFNLRVKPSFDWRRGCRGGADAGEYLVPAYVDPEEFAGVQFFDRSGFTDKYVSQAYYRIDYSGTTVVARYSLPPKQKCVEQGTDRKLYPCEPGWDAIRGRDIPLYPPLATLRIDLPPFPPDALFVRCDRQKPNCGLPAGIFKDLEVRGNCAPKPMPKLGWDGVEVRMLCREE